MDIVEFLRSVEWMCHSDMRGLMENDRPYEAATEIESLRQEVAHDLVAINALELRVIKLTAALQAVVDAHGTGKPNGGPWLDQAVEALKEKA